MARIFTIIAILCLLDVSYAGKHLYIINQNNSEFVADADLWELYFKSKYTGLSFSRSQGNDVQAIAAHMLHLCTNLTSNDTLFLVVTSHMIPNPNADKGMRGALLLKDDGSLPDLNKDVIWQYTVQYWLNHLEIKKVKTLVILNTCEPYLIADSIFAKSLQYITLVYTTNKQYSILYRDAGSIFVNSMFSAGNLPSMGKYCRYMRHDWLNKRYYQFYDEKAKFNAMELYPIHPVMFGNDFKF